MTQFIEPNKKSDLVAPRVLDWLQSLRSGLLEGFLVTKTGPLNDFDIDITSGKIVLKGSTIHDDETRLGSALLSSQLAGPLGADTHCLIYATYTYQDTFPPSSMTLNADVTTGSPPVSPALPADSIKIADVFIPSGASDLTDAVIVPAPKMPDRGINDTDTLIEKLVNSNLNVVFSGGGAITYNGVDTIEWTEAMSLVSTTTSHKERFNSAALVRGEVAGPSTLAGAGDNCIVFTVFDRTNPSVDLTVPASLTLYVLNFAAPDQAAANVFFNPTTRDDIVVIGTVIDGILTLRSGFGSGLPPSIGPGTYFLRQDPLGGPLHEWSIITEDMIQNIITITQFDLQGTNLFEKGTVVDLPAFDVAYDNDTPVTTTLSNNFAGGPENIIPATNNPVVSALTGFVRTGTGGNETIVFDLDVVGSLSPTVVNAVNTLTWARFMYWGKDATASPTLNEAFVKGLTSNQLLTGNNKRVTFTGGAAPANEYVFFAWSTIHGNSPSFFDHISGLPADGAFQYMGLASNVDLENLANGPILNDYHVWRTNNQINTDFDVSVS